MSDAPSNLPDWIGQHTALYLSDPEKAHMWDSSMAGGTGILPTLLLVSTGRKSGEEKMLPLIYKKIGNDYVIVASKGGAPSHPAWYLNLMAKAECDIRVGKDIYSVKARVASDDERLSMWDEMAEVYPPYNDYKKFAGDREIPVVVLEVQ